MKRVAIVLGLLLVLAPSAHGAAWKPAGVIASTSFQDLPFAATVDRFGDALFAWSPPTKGLFSRARGRRGPLGASSAVTPTHVDEQPLELAGNPSGDAVMAWPEPIADSGQDTRREVAALRPPGGDFGPPQTLYEGVFRGGGPICTDSAAIADDGTSMVVFGVFVPFDGCRLLAAVRPPGAAQFEQTVELAPPATFQPQVAFDAHGNALIAWGQLGERGIEIETMRYLPRAGGFQPKQQIGVEGEALDRRAPGPLLLRVSEPTGAAIVTYPSLNLSTGAKHIAAAIGSTRSGFGPVAKLSGRVRMNSGTPTRRLAAAAGADGTLAVAWRTGTRAHHRIQVARVGPGAESITSLDTNTLSKERAAEVALGIADDGRVTVAWTRFLRYPVPRAVETATGAPSEHFAGTQRVSKQGASLPRVATNSRGDQFLAWLEGRGFKRTAHWATASKRDGHFGRAGRMPGAPDLTDVRLYRGRLGAMLAAVRRSSPSGSSWSLLTYGER